MSDSLTAYPVMTRNVRELCIGLGNCLNFL